MGYDIRILLSAHLRILWTIGHRKSNSNGLSGRILHLKAEIPHLKLDDQMQAPIRNFEISDLRCRIRPIFKSAHLPARDSKPYQVCDRFTSRTE